MQGIQTKISFWVLNKPRVIIWTQMRDFEVKTCEEKVFSKESSNYINQVNRNLWNHNTIFLCQNIKAQCLSPTTILFVSIRPFWGKNECCLTFWNKNRYVWFPKNARTMLYFNSNPKFHFGPKQAEGNHLNLNERFWSQNMWGKRFQ